MKNSQPNNKQTTTEKRSDKKTYSKPQTLSKEPLEAMAVVCSGGGSKANPGVCPSGPITS